MTYSIEKEIDDFLVRVLPRGASYVQREEMKKAAWAGFAICFDFVTERVPLLDDEAAEAALSDVHRQLTAYGRDLLGRVAVQGRPS